MNDTQLINNFQQARGDDKLVVLEGFHALKHALRFGGEVTNSVTPDKTKLLELAEQLAPDLNKIIQKLVREIDSNTYNRLAPIPSRSGVISIAKRPNYSLDTISPRGKIVLLDDPRDHQNVGAVIRVSAAADATTVLTTGQLNPWKPSVLRGSAGLHFALPVIRVTVQEILALGRPLIGLDEHGTDFQGGSLETNSVLVFGSERAGISPRLRENLSSLVRIPMASGVSSLNLATSVAIALYSV